MAERNKFWAIQDFFPTMSNKAIAYECRFKVVLIGPGGNGSPTVYLLTPADSLILRAAGRDELALAKEVLIADEIDSHRTWLVWYAAPNEVLPRSSLANPITGEIKMTKRMMASAALALTAFAFAACSPAEKTAPVAEIKRATSPTATPAIPETKIVRSDPSFDKLVPADAKVEKLAEGFIWTEGPVWNKKESYLLFSNIPGNEIIKWQEGKGTNQFLHPAGYSGTAPFTGKEPGTNGLTYNAEGQLVMCQHGDRRVAWLAADGKITSLADKYEGKRFNSPNDLVYHSNGSLYFTDPPYGLPKGVDDPQREMDYCGVYRLGKDGKVTLLTKEITRPNGIALSPDEKKLYVASSDPDKAIWMVYDVRPDGMIANGKIFFDATAWAKEKRPGLPDGLKVDKDGNVYATGPGGLHVFSPEGKLLGTFDTGVPTANCAFGGDGSTLYITANTALLRVKLNTKGKGF